MCFSLSLSLSICVCVIFYSNVFYFTFNFMLHRKKNTHNVLFSFLFCAAQWFSFVVCWYKAIPQFTLQSLNSFMLQPSQSPKCLFTNIHLTFISGYKRKSKLIRNMTVEIKKILGFFVLYFKKKNSDIKFQTNVIGE